ncbi:imidazolonepropionase [Desulfofustis limnaeus]|jgi:imidazolonepropionase|uniref:Imidazolonepropionase n=1 Tax=Desulfofustis limnaeus TaxID=2740163 RepID=A0ABM7W6H4_9BACT|nr:imidazolonepropionase [Desulfofustis limnaeus]MDX9894980.1 imidazolonepropionase [Desulfofustis sp.]BDD86557.1 imidazolonepropionase [Desulfofustis limnaeus]
MTTTLYKKARIYTPVDEGRARGGKKQGQLACFPDGALLVEDGTVAALGPYETVLRARSGQPPDAEIDCGNKCLVPGFVDPHTHLCFAATREAEFDLRLAGTPYLEILKRGGGILSSVQAVARASEQFLADVTLERALTALRHGTTTLEIKSGYGLDQDNELKMLRAIRQAAARSPQDIVATFLGAHAIPEVYRGRSDDFIALLIHEVLPLVKEEGLADACDIFCEEGVFSIEQGRRLLRAAQGLGFRVKLHADEVHDLGGAALAAELRALSADHLLAAHPDNLQRMAAAGVVATLLPVTAYSLKKPFAKARQMINQGLPVALATDCNPGSSYCESMVFAFGLAVLLMDLTPAEALTAATLNGAYALGLADRVGSLDVGKQADFLLLDGESPSILPYHAGVSSVQEVYKKGRRVV